MKARTLWIMGGGAALLLLFSSRANAATAGGESGVLAGVSGGGSSSGVSSAGFLDSITKAVGDAVKTVTGAISGGGAVTADPIVYPTAPDGGWTTQQVADAMGRGLAATPGATIEQVVMKAVNSYGVTLQQASQAALIAPVYSSAAVDGAARTSYTAQSVAESMRAGLAATPGATIEETVQRAISVYGIPEDLARVASRLV